MLKPKKKITRKELKKDPVLEKISQIENLVRKQRKLDRTIIGVCRRLRLFYWKNFKKKAPGGWETGMAECHFARNDYDDAIFARNLIEKYLGP